MAGPLDWFRKNQKLLLGVFGVLLIFTFTISLGSGVDPIVDYFSGGGGPSSVSNSVVATWKNGSMKRADFTNLRQGRVLMNNFLRVVLMRTQERGGQPQTYPLPSQTSDQSLMRLVVLSQEAKQLGLHVDDTMALDYLERLSGGTIRPSEFGTLLKAVTQRQISERQVLTLLRRELLAQKLIVMAQSGTTPATPIATWDFYNRLEQQLSAEMVAFPVNEFVGQIEDPQPGDVQKLFDKYKDRYRSPMAPEPGFKQRKKIAFQFVQANYQAFLEKAKQNVMDADIAKYYEENPDEFSIEQGDDEQQPEAAASQHPQEPDLQITDQESDQPKTKPLDEVKLEIQTQLARPAAQTLMDDALAKSRQRVDRFFKENLKWEIQIAQNAEATKPEFPEFSDLGSSEQITFGEIPLVDQIEVQDYGLGQAYELNLLENRVQRISFAEMAFSDNLPNYKSQEIPAYEIDSKFLFWKTDEAEPRIPELEEIEDQVKHQWKRQKAVEMARVFVEEKEKLARKEKMPLAQCGLDLGERTIIHTGDIHWMTIGNAPLGDGGAPRLGMIPGVPGAGFDFMKTVFRTAPEDVCVVVDEPEENVYLVRVESAKPEVVVRRDGFNEMGAELPGLMQLARIDSSRFINNWVAELLDRYEVEWKSDPNNQGDG